MLLSAHSNGVRFLEAWLRWLVLVTLVCFAGRIPKPVASPPSFRSELTECLMFLLSVSQEKSKTRCLQQKRQKAFSEWRKLLLALDKEQKGAKWHG